MCVPVCCCWWSLVWRGRRRRKGRPVRSSAASPTNQGAVLPGVTVTLSGAGVAGTPTVVTPETGTYRFPLLPPGHMIVEYTLGGFTTLKRTAIPVSVGATVELEIKLTVGALTEALTVKGEAPVVNASSAEVSTSYNREWVRNAPVRRFSYFDLINSAPGVSATSNVGQSTAAQSLGSSTNENSYQIDGTDISSTPWPNTDAVEEVEVLQLGASAEYGNVQGAVFNIVTRQGSNVFHGDANVYFQSDALTGRNTTDAVDRGFPYHRETWRDATRAGVGPVHAGQVLVLRLAAVSARLRFAAGRRSTVSREERRAPRVLEVQLQHQPEPSADARVSRRLLLDSRHADGVHRAEHDRPEPRRQPDAEPRVHRRAVGHDLPRGALLGLLAEELDRSERRRAAARADPDSSTRTPGSSPAASRAGRRTAAGATGYRASCRTYTERLLGRQPRSEGRHPVRRPRQRQPDRAERHHHHFSVTGRPSPGTTQLPYHQGAHVRWMGAYVDDTYRLGRAVVNFGVRFDHSQASFPSLPFLDAAGRETGQMSPANDDVYHWNTFSPRVGVNYRVNASGRTVVKAHYGRYYKAMEATEFRPAVPSISPSFDFTFDAAGNRDQLRADRRATRTCASTRTSRRRTAISSSCSSSRKCWQPRRAGELRAQARRGLRRWQDIAGVYAQVPYIDNQGIDATGRHGDGLPPAVAIRPTASSC